MISAPLRKHIGGISMGEGMHIMVPRPSCPQGVRTRFDASIRERCLAIQARLTATKRTAIARACDTCLSGVGWGGWANGLRGQPIGLRLQNCEFGGTSRSEWDFEGWKWIGSVWMLVWRIVPTCVAACPHWWMLVWRLVPTCGCLCGGLPCPHFPSSISERTKSRRDHPPLRAHE